MVKVVVPFGNGCQLCESYGIITMLQDLFKNNNISGFIEIEEHHCSGKCNQGITLRINEEEVKHVSTAKIPAIFKNKIMSK